MWNEIRSSQSLHISCENILRFKTEKLYLCSSFHVFVVKCVGWVPVAVSQSPHNLSAHTRRPYHQTHHHRHLRPLLLVSPSSARCSPGPCRPRCWCEAFLRLFLRKCLTSTPGSTWIWTLAGVDSFGFTVTEKIHNFNVELSWCRYYHHYI